MEELWTAVCSNDIPTVEKYFSSGWSVNQRYPRFGMNHSLIMGAVRNGQIEMVRLLRSYGETVEDYEEDEYRQRIASLRREYYKEEIERLKARGTGLHFNFEIDDGGKNCTGVCLEYPEFEYGGSVSLDDAYYELCEWLRKNPGA